MLLLQLCILLKEQAGLSLAATRVDGPFVRLPVCRPPADCLVRADGGGFAEQLQGADTEQGPERPPVFSPRSFLLGLQLLDLLEQRAQLARAAGGPGQPGSTVLEGVAAGLGRLAALAAQGQPVQISGLVKIFVPVRCCWSSKAGTAGSGLARTGACRALRPAHEARI